MHPNLVSLIKLYLVLPQSLYFVKLFSFQAQLQRDQDISPALERMARFVALPYITAWLKAPITADTPCNDSMLWNELQE